MFGLEKIADLFDSVHKENKSFVKGEMQEWVDSSYQKHGDGWQFTATAASAATLDAIHTLTGGVASGLLDTLRVGEGVKEGTMGGIAKDGLRVLSVAGGAFKAVRLASAEVAIGGQATCTISSSAKAAALSGRGMLQSSFRTLADKLGGVKQVTSPSFKGTSSPLEFVNELRQMGGKVSLGNVKVAEDVIAIAKQAKGPVVFGYQHATGGHTMTAFRNLFGQVRFADQYGRTMSALPQGIKMFGQAAVVHDGVLVEGFKAGMATQMLGTPLINLNPKVLHQLEQAVRNKLGRPSALPAPKGLTSNFSSMAGKK